MNDTLAPTNPELQGMTPDMQQKAAEFYENHQMLAAVAEISKRAILATPEADEEAMNKGVAEATEHYQQNKEAYYNTAVLEASFKDGVDINTGSEQLHAASVTPEDKKPATFATQAPIELPDVVPPQSVPSQ